MATRGTIRIAALAFVIEDGNGNQTLYGSKQVDSISIDFGFDSYADGPNMRHSPTGGFSLSADGYNLFTRRAERMAEQPHLSQRGIYLPDMSFRALPAPNEEPTDER